MTATREQVDEMLLFIEDHPEMARNYNLSSCLERQNLNTLWNVLTTKLNAMSYPHKTSAGWRKVWTNRKHRAKKKLINKKFSPKKTGGKSSEEVTLTANQEKIVELANLQAVTDGSENVRLIDTPTDFDEFSSTRNIVESSSVVDFRSPSKKQMNEMLRFIKDHREMVKNYKNSSHQRQNLDKLWDELRMKLNSIGYSNKTSEGWKEVWTNLKRKAKQRLINQKLSQKKPVEGLSEELTLDTEEEKLELANFETVVDESKDEVLVDTSTKIFDNDEPSSTSFEVQSSTWADFSSAPKEQVNEMLLFFEDHPEMTKNYNKCSSKERQNLNRLWDELRTKLNSMGYPNKTTAGWRKVWAECNYNATKASGVVKSSNVVDVKTVSVEQVDEMLRFIENHPEMAKNYHKRSLQGRQKLKRLWDKLRTKLNSIGHLNKTTEGWRKIWADYKYKAKQKLINKKLSLKKTKGRASEEVALTARQEKVVELADLETAVAGNEDLLLIDSFAKTFDKHESPPTSRVAKSSSLIDFKAPSNEQVVEMLYFIDDHPEMAQYYHKSTSQGRQKLDRLWDELTMKLNTIGYANKTSADWRKFWAKYKYRAKKKLLSKELCLKAEGESSEELIGNQEKLVELADFQTAVSDYEELPLIDTSTKTFADDELPLISRVVKCSSLKDFRSPSNEQVDEMLRFIEDHPEMAQNYNKNTTQGRQNLNRLWDELTTKLNTIGFPNKTSAGWRKIWSDYKYKAKKKLIDKELSMKKADGGASDEVVLTANQKKIVELANLQAAVADNEDDLMFDNDEFPSTSRIGQICSVEDFVSEDSISIPSTKRKRSYQNEYAKKSNAYSGISDLLREQINNRRKYQEEVFELMKERNQEKKWFHTKVLELVKEKNDLFF